MKVCTVVGARPQFVKAAVVSKEIASRCGVINEVLIHTGQHFDKNMSDVFFDELGIKNPAYNLGVGGGSHGQNTGRMLEGLEPIFIKERPDWLVVYGDTDSTLAASLCASKLNIPIAHVEAGLRSFNKRMPEEINRILTDHLSDLLFAPTATARRHLENEGIRQSIIECVGDVMCDASLYYRRIAEAKSSILTKLRLKKKGYVLGTIHRVENTENFSKLDAIIRGWAECIHPIVLPVHPRLRNAFQKSDLSLPGNVISIEPVGYLDMCVLEANAVAICTDSGGVQKEAYFYSVPCVTTRSETEWTETVELGWNTIVGDDSNLIANLLNDPISPAAQADLSLYGSGKSCKQIVDRLLSAI